MTITTATPAQIEWTKRTSRATLRMIARCKCKAAHSVAIVRVVTSSYRSDKIGAVSRTERYETTDGEPATYPQPRTCACGRTAHYRPVKGALRPDKACNAKCLASTGFVCECSCGGKNHGAAHAH